jgi:IclR family acetate operon transcriptional repressor
MKSYVLGSSIWRLSHHYDWSNMLVMVAHPYLKELADQTGETAHLAVREGEKALFIDHVIGNHVIAVSGQVGELVPLYCTAHGKALLVDYTVPQLQALFGKTALRTYTRQTAASLERLISACTQIRAVGYATDDGEYQEGLCCVAAPIRDHDGMVIGSIGISAPATRLPERRRRACGEQVMRAAQAIREALSTRAQEAPEKVD